MDNEEIAQMPYVPNFTVAPNNLRKMIQTSIDRTVHREMDSLNANNSTTDGRFLSSRKVNTAQTESSTGRPFFVVGSSPVTCKYVAAP